LTARLWKVTAAIVGPLLLLLIIVVSYLLIRAVGEAPISQEEKQEHTELVHVVDGASYYYQGEDLGVGGRIAVADQHLGSWTDPFGIPVLSKPVTGIDWIPSENRVTAANTPDHILVVRWSVTKRYDEKQPLKVVGVTPKCQIDVYSKAMQAVITQKEIAGREYPPGLGFPSQEIEAVKEWVREALAEGKRRAADPLAWPVLARAPLNDTGPIQFRAGASERLSPNKQGGTQFVLPLLRHKVIRSPEELVAASKSPARQTDPAAQSEAVALLAKSLSVRSIDWNKQMIIAVAGGNVITSIRKDGTGSLHVRRGLLAPSTLVKDCAYSFRARPSDQEINAGTAWSSEKTGALALVARFEGEIVFEVGPNHPTAQNVASAPEITLVNRMPLEPETVPEAGWLQRLYQSRRFTAKDGTTLSYRLWVRAPDAFQSDAFEPRARIPRLVICLRGEESWADNPVTETAAARFMADKVLRERYPAHVMEPVIVGDPRWRQEPDKLLGALVEANHQLREELGIPPSLYVIGESHGEVEPFRVLATFFQRDPLSQPATSRCMLLSNWPQRVHQNYRRPGGGTGLIYGQRDGRMQSLASAMDEETTRFLLNIDSDHACWHTAYDYLPLWKWFFGY
jgi:hypothetical protein